MAIADVLGSIKGVITSSSKTNNEFRVESAKNNKNITNALRDISRMFSAQKATDAKHESMISDVLELTEKNSKGVSDNNELLKQSISMQKDMLDELRSISTGVKALVSSAEEGQGNGNNNSLSAIALRTAATALGLGATALPGVLNNFFGNDTGTSGNNQGPFNQGVADTGGGQNLTVADMVRIAKGAGFNDQDAATIAAIGAAESSGNTRAHNTTGADDSYGLFQINMKGNLGPERRAKFGISSDEELFDPQVNARAAMILFRERGGFGDWSTYNSGKYQQYMGTAQAALTEGDEPDYPYDRRYNDNGNTDTPTPQSSVMGGGNVYEQQSTLAGIRKQSISDQLKSVLTAAAAAAGVDVVVYSGGQPSKASGKGPRTGSTRHDDGNAADLYLMRDGRKLEDTNSEDRQTMAKFVSAAVQNGATGVGAGHNYMGPSNIHVGFGRPATWGGAPWIAAAASGVYNNKDLQAESMGQEGYAGGMDESGEGGAMMATLSTVFKMFGMGGINIPNFLASTFGVPFLGSYKDEQGNYSFGTEEEGEEGSDTSNQFPGRSRGIGGATAEEIKQYRQSTEQKPEKDFINYERYGSLADQIKEATMLAQNPPNITPAPNATGTTPEIMTDFGATGNEPRNTRASWAPRVAVLRPDDNAAASLRWAARISPALSRG